MNGWKLCRDEVPDDDSTVLGWHPDWDEVEACFLDAGKWRFTSAALCNPQPSHWRHLPEPPTIAG